jgi:hypothetical protein
MGILSRGLQGFAQGAGDYMKAELKDEMSERGWLRRQAYLEKQRALARDESRVFDAEKAKIERFRKEDREDELDLETEDMRLLKLKEQAEIKKNTRLQDIKDRKDLQDRKWQHDALVKTNFGGYGSQEKFDARIEKLADIEFGDKFDSLSESTYKDLTGKVIEDSNHWLKARSEYMSKVKNEIIDGGYKTITDWEQRDRKPKTGTPTPTGTTPEFNQTRYDAFISDFRLESGVRLGDPQSGAESQNPADANNYQKEIANTMIEFLDMQPDKWDDKTRSGFASLGVKDHADLETLFWKTTGIKAKVWRKYVQNK